MDIHDDADPRSQQEVRMRILDKIMQFIRRNPDKVDRVVNKVGDAVDRRTGGKYRNQINRGRDMARKTYGDRGRQAPGTNGTPGGQFPGTNGTAGGQFPGTDGTPGRQAPGTSGAPGMDEPPAPRREAPRD
ncbi:hypothetical protein CGZ94_17800 [Enemella evansiae]|uniref:Antitoxin n=2 Tax=Enemella evansiae TaxID=2016499 RepID=A0A255G0R0_9ACTN|nr:hypothetical protein CGZ96_05055 [Enemella evansiae]OYO02756.1 hypothetical protein CGZ95_05355 [Enemella evansiae]OYO05575.1 hypothetical protein CGZ97_02340 [Enemella evansiae]OYO09528.1 hypothetical protein CGZ94_17800 [Enemella evansiae]OYO15234.1 hypothetical protein CGZ98_02050 [Enemella evansiae]